MEICKVRRESDYSAPAFHSYSPTDTHRPFGSTSSAFLIPSLHREKAINKDKIPVYVRPIKHQQKFHGCTVTIGGEKTKKLTKREGNGDVDVLKLP